MDEANGVARRIRPLLMRLVNALRGLIVLMRRSFGHILNVFVEPVERLE